jgi:hypothetical protein
MIKKSKEWKIDELEVWRWLLMLCLIKAYKKTHKQEKETKQKEA